MEERVVVAGAGWGSVQAVATWSRPSVGEMDRWELEAKEAIRELLASYAHAVDRGRFVEMAELFAPDGVLELEDRAPLAGRDAIATMLGGVKGQLAATGDGAFIRHHVSSVSIELVSPDQARAWSYFLAITHRGPDHWGRYRDDLTFDDQSWRFRRRRVSVDGRSAVAAL